MTQSLIQQPIVLATCSTTRPFQECQLLPITAIGLPTQQPRRYFDPEAMRDLIKSIQEYGVLEPLIVRPCTDETYELVAGERRLRAAQSAGLTEVPVIVRHLSSEQALKISLVENLLREDLNPLEETEGVLQLLQLHLGMPTQQVVSLLYRMQNDAQRLTRNVMGQPEALLVQDVFQEIGMSWESFINNRLPLLKLSADILNVLREGKLSYTKAREIARVKDESQRLALLEVAVAENLPLSQVKARVAAVLAQSANVVALSTESSSQALKSLMESAYRSVRRSKVWDNPAKREQLEVLLRQLQALATE